MCCGGGGCGYLSRAGFGVGGGGWGGGRGSHLLAPPPQNCSFERGFTYQVCAITLPALSSTLPLDKHRETSKKAKVDLEMGGREIARGGGLLDTPDPIFDTFWHFGGGGGGWGVPNRVITYSLSLSGVR